MELEESKEKEIGSPLKIGELLNEARNNLHLSIKDIASALNLTPSVIEGIERNSVDPDIPATFIRGYVKSYATKVGLDTRRILTEFDKQASSDYPSLKRVEAISNFNEKRKEING